MWRNYFKTAWRNIFKTVGYSAINVFGLAIGMAVALLIGLWVHYQNSYDKFLPEYKSAYRVQRNFYSNGDTLTFLSTSLKLAQSLRDQIPELEYVAASAYGGGQGLMVGDKKLLPPGFFCEADFFKIFPYKFIQGNANAALSDPYSIVLTQSLAKSLFGDADPINQFVRFENANNLKVTGVIKDLPANASLTFQYIVPVEYYFAVHPDQRKEAFATYASNIMRVFVKLKKGVPYSQVAGKIRNIEHTETGSTNAMQSYVTLQPMERWHLYSNYVNGKDQAGFLSYVRMFSIVGIFVLLIACINFVNLSTARSEKRAREVGVRKAIGSDRKDLVFQFLTESFLLTFIAFVLTLLIVILVLPSFNALTGTSIQIPYGDPAFWLLLIGSMIAVSLMAGSRPAFYLSSFQPIKVLKGTLQTGKGASLSRKILVVTQFSCSIALIISTFIIYQQINHARSRPTGYDSSRLMQTNLTDDLIKNFEALSNELQQKGLVSSAAMTSSPATGVYWHTDLDNWPGKNPGETLELGCINVSQDYFKTIGMQLKEGRFFVNNDDSTSVILNEAAVARMRFKTPIGTKFMFQQKEYTVAGVVKDALMNSPFEAADPTMFYCTDGGGSLLYRLNANVSTQDAVAAMTGIFGKYDASAPYTYSFVDADYAAKFKVETLVGRLAGIFAGLAIFISCLGLFGLAAYTAEQRKKEIGIRKVLGASVQQVWVLLSKDFVWLVLISCLIATPISYYFLHNWLMNYNYRISIGAGVFVFGALMALVITIITISFQAIKAAIANPVRSLRSE